MRAHIQELRQELRIILQILRENQVAKERMDKVGVISTSLARDFGFVGVTARASGIAYDCRQHFPHGLYPKMAPPIVTRNSGDIRARARVRAGEIETSLDTIEKILEQFPAGPALLLKLPDTLAANQIGLAIVEAFSRRIDSYDFY